MKKEKASSTGIKQKALRRAFALGCVKFAGSEEAFFKEDFGPTANFIACKRKSLKGDFNKLAEHLYKKYQRDDRDGRHMSFYGALNSSQVKSEIIHLRGKAKCAAKEVYRDMELLRKNGAVGVSLRIISDQGYAPTPQGLIKNPTHQYHVDGGGERKGRFLCRYTGAETENLVPKDAVLSMTLQEFRDIVKEKYEHDKSMGNTSGLAKCFDTLEAYLKYVEEAEIYYSAKENAIPFSFGIGDFVRQATRGNSAGVPPGIHRAKKMKKGDPLKMLLVADFPTF